VLIGIAATGCHESPAAFGSTPEAARVHADDLFTGLEERFTNVERSPAFAAARAKLGRDALVPSRVYDDSAVWSTMSGDSGRGLVVGGRFSGDHYLFAVVPVAAGPERLADARHDIHLAKLGRGEFEWTTSVVQALGTVTAVDLDRVTGSMLSAAATVPGPALRAGSIGIFPRTAAALGRLVSLDTVRTEPLGDGSAIVRLSAVVHPEGLRSAYPAYADYLLKYVGSVRFRVALTDSGHTDWFRVQLADDRLTVTLRTTGDGHFAPLGGPVRPMPETLTLRTDIHSKAWIFSVGLTDLVGDFLITRTPHERGWHLVFRREPKWHFPLLVDHLVKSSLRRPFAGDGMSYRIAVRDTTTGPTLLVRDARVDVQESTIMRWLGGLGASAMGDFSGPSETQESAFFAEVFAALRSDVRGALGDSGANNAASGETVR
jgi:hypothetical protein